MKKRGKKANKKKKLLLTIIILFILLLVVLGLILIINNNNNDEEPIAITDYSTYYSEYVVANKDAEIYLFKEGEYIEAGTIYKDTKLMLDDNYDKSSEYFLIKDLNNTYYIKYSDIDKSDSYYEEDSRYKNYIVYNENVVTSDKTTFYSDNGKMYTINESYNLPIIIKEEDRYYVEYNDMLLYVLKDEISDIIDSDNTELVNTKGVPVLNYHFVYYPEEETCDQEICHTETQFRTHLSYIKDNGYFTPTMKELEMYIDEKIQLPKSVVITIDDGRNVNIATKLLEEYKLNATAFIVTSRYNVEEDFIKSDYVELQSHSHSLHDVGTCPPGHGQGGGLTCLSDNEILEDLRLSREALDGAIAFCYPFYEYNSHSIELLKEAGFTMAFAGEYTGGKTKATIGIDKFRIPRWVIVNWTSMSDFISYVSGTA